MPKQVPPLTARHIEKLKVDPTRRLELVDGMVPGLRVRLSPSGTLSWSMNVRVAGQRRRLAVGEGLMLAEARRKAEDMRRRLSVGEDPAAEVKARRQRAADAKAGLGTFGTVVGTYFTTGPGEQLRSGLGQRKLVEIVFAAHLDRPAIDVKPGELQLAVDAWGSKSSGAHAAAYVRPVCRWATKRGLMSAGFEALEAPSLARESIKRPALTPEQAGLLLRALGHTAHDDAARAMLMTACRREEVCGATWAEIDLHAGTWTIAAARRKDTRPAARVRRRAAVDHVIPLPRQLLDALQARGQGEPHDLVWSGVRSARLQNWARWSRGIEATTGLKDIGPHTLRRTAATLLGRLGHPPHVVSAVLGHTAIGGGLHAGYNQATYTAEVDAALQSLADWLDVLAHDQDNIVALPRRSA